MPTRALILILLSMSSAPAWAKQTVTSVKPLLVQALKTGSASGVLVNPDARAFSKTFGSNAPILIEVTRIGTHQEAGCGRLRVTTSQAGVVERDTKGQPQPAKDQRLMYQVNYCENGRFPIGEEGL